MAVQSRPRTQLPALQLLPFFGSVFPTLNGMHRGGCSVGAGRTCVADPALVHVLGITLQGEACVSLRAHGLVPITWQRVRALLVHPHAAASSPAACPPASVSAHQPPSDLQSGWEVAGLPPQPSHTDSPAACLVPFQTTQMLLINGVPIV